MQCFCLLVSKLIAQNARDGHQRGGICLGGFVTENMYIHLAPRRPIQVEQQCLPTLYWFTQHIMQVIRRGVLACAQEDLELEKVKNAGMQQEFFSALVNGSELWTKTHPGVSPCTQNHLGNKDRYDKIHFYPERGLTEALHEGMKGCHCRVVDMGT